MIGCALDKQPVATNGFVEGHGFSRGEGVEKKTGL